MVLCERHGEKAGFRAIFLPLKQLDSSFCQRTFCHLLSTTHASGLLTRSPAAATIALQVTCGSQPPMRANEILALRPRIEQFLRLFDECFIDDRTRSHLRVYVQGQLSNLPRKKRRAHCNGRRDGSQDLAAVLEPGQVGPPPDAGSTPATGRLPASRSSSRRCL